MAVELSPTALQAWLPNYLFPPPARTFHPTSREPSIFVRQEIRCGRVVKALDLNHHDTVSNSLGSTGSNPVGGVIVLH